MVIQQWVPRAARQGEVLFIDQRQMLTFGYLEDPATGSGNSAFGYYLMKNKIWDGTFMSLEQNGSFENPNIIKLMAKDTEGAKPQVVFGGGAIVRIDGEYILQ